MLKFEIKNPRLTYENFELLITERIKVSRKIHVVNPCVKEYFRLLDEKLSIKIEEFKKEELYEVYLKQYSIKHNQIG